MNEFDNKNNMQVRKSMNGEYSILSIRTELNTISEPQEKTNNLVVRGYAAVYNEPTNIVEIDERGNLIEYIEIVRKGAFDKVDFSNTRVCVEHDFKKQIGRNNKNAKIVADDTGLYAECRSMHKTQLRRDVYNDVEDEILDGMSIRFHSPDKIINGVREVKNITIVPEVSIVAFPAYEATAIGVLRNNDNKAEKTLEDSEIEKKMEKTEIGLDNAKKRAESKFTLADAIMELKEIK